MSSPATRTAPPSSGTSSAETGAPDPGAETDSEPDLDALRNREPWAIRRWILPKQHYIRGVLVRHGVDRRNLDELVQETLFQALRSLPNFKGASRLRTWLYGVARNVAYNFHQTEQRQSAHAPGDMGVIQYRAPSSPCLAEAKSDPQESTIRRERRDILHRALETLPEHYREVIQLRDLDGRTTDEAAQDIGITNVNTRVRLHRARQSLREVLSHHVTGSRIPEKVMSSD
jgi:RNA polymerase sigma-70 factor (ECF subfamily)